MKKNSTGISIANFTCLREWNGKPLCYFIVIKLGGSGWWEQTHESAGLGAY